jgi:hypothetical protein
MSFIIPFQNLPHTLGGTRTTGWETLVYTWFIVQLGTLTIPVVLKDIFPVAAVAAAVGFRWPLWINHTKKAVKFKYLSSCISTFLIWAFQRVLNIGKRRDFNILPTLISTDGITKF